MKNYFKNENEIKAFFKNEMLKFSLMADNAMLFETLAPIRLGDVFYNFEFAFYYEDCEQFFCYQSAKDLIEDFKIQDVQAISIDDNSRTQMFFQTYDS